MLMAHDNLDHNNYKPYIRELQNIIKLFRKKGFHICLDGGTLLGAARDKDFIKTDDDIDIFYISKQTSLTSVIKEFDKVIKPFLTKKGYAVEPISWTVRKRKTLMLGQYHITKNGIVLDLWASWFNPEGKFYLSHCITGEMDKKDIYPLTKLTLNNSKYFVPNNYDKLLTLLYKEWKTPGDYRPKANPFYFQKNILKIIDVYGWAYHFIALDQQKYSVHNINFCRLNDLKNYNLDNIDIIYFPSPGMGIGRISAAIKKIRNNYPYIKIIGAYAGENKVIYPDADMICSISAKHLLFLKETYSKFPVIFLPESVDTEFFYPLNKNRYRRFKPGYAGRKHPVKRLHLLDKLNFKIKKKTDHSPTFYTKDRTLEPMRKFYHSIDCIVMSSISECMPRVVLEGMACGLPVISTAVGSLNMVVDKDWLIYEEDEDKIVEKLNEKLSKLKNDRTLRKNVGKRNREFICKYFDWKINQSLWDEVFSHLYSKNFEKMKEITEQFNSIFYDKEPILKMTNFPIEKQPNKIKEEKIEKIEPISVPPLNLDVLNMTINDILKEIRFLLFELHLPCVLMQDTCLHAVVNHKLKGLKLFIATKTLKEDSILYLESKGYEFISGERILKKGNFIIDLNVRLLRKTKEVHVLNDKYNVPLPVVPYLSNLYGKDWKEKGKIE
jgi:glycosyltransferase involved in cell wall biosynthesis